MEYGPHLLALLNSTAPRLEKARERGLVTSLGASVIADKVEALRAAIEIHHTELTRLRGDKNLSEAGRNSAIQQLYEGALEAVTGIAHDLQGKVESEVSRMQKRAAPTPTGVSAEALEARMANARTDARMVLDPLADTEVHKSLADLATNGDEAMRHLILATNWPDLYLRSRNSGTAEALWANQRPGLMSLVLDEAGQEAVHALQAEPDLRAVATITRHAADAWAHDMNPRASLLG